MGFDWRLLPDFRRTDLCDQSWKYFTFLARKIYTEFPQPCEGVSRWMTPAGTSRSLVQRRRRSRWFWWGYRWWQAWRCSQSRRRRSQTESWSWIRDKVYPSVSLVLRHTCCIQDRSVTRFWSQRKQNRLWFQLGSIWEISHQCYLVPAMRDSHQIVIHFKPIKTELRPLERGKDSSS